jgi:hypothetical protein
MTREKNHPLEPLYWSEFQVTLGTPERELLWAVLNRAILDRVESKAKEERRGALRFFKDLPEDRGYLFSLHSIAEHLSNDAEVFKAGILKHIAGRLDGKIVRKGARTVKPQ